MESTLTFPQPQTPAAGGSAHAPTVSPGKILVIASGVFMFLASFLAWLKFGSDGVSAWTTDYGLFPVALFPTLFGLLSAALAGVRLLAPNVLPRRLWEFTWEQIHLVLALFASLLVFGYLVMERSGLDLGLGYFANLLGAVGLLAGAVLMIVESLSPASRRAAGPRWNQPADGHPDSPPAFGQAPYPQPPQSPVQQAPQPPPAPPYQQPPPQQPPSPAPPPADPWPPSASPPPGSSAF